MIAFIFTSLADLPGARAVRDHLVGHGVRCLIARDDKGELAGGEIRTSFPRGGRLVGTDCVAGIFETMAMHAADEPVVAKVDADTRLDEEGITWLAGAESSGRAHGFAVGSHAWSGIWSLPAAAIGHCLREMHRHKRCWCPEASLVRRVFAGAIGWDVHPRKLAVWRPGIEEPSPGSTLPSGLSRDMRNRSLAMMFPSIREKGWPSVPSPPPARDRSAEPPHDARLDSAETPQP